MDEPGSLGSAWSCSWQLVGSRDRSVRNAKGWDAGHGHRAVLRHSRRENSTCDAAGRDGDAGGNEELPQISWNSTSG